jgi:hypothetical protein
MRDPDALRHERDGMPVFGPGASHPEHGARTDAGSTETTIGRGGTEQLQLAQFSPGPPIRPGHPIVMVLSLFAALSARNTPNQRAIFEFNAKEFVRDPSSELAQPKTKILNREEVENVCRKLEDVQTRTDRAADDVEMNNKRTGLPMSRSQIGSAMHVHVKRQIDGLGDPNYRAEVSYWKDVPDARYGKKHSIRIDVLENAGRGLVCVYDIKTGQSRSSGLDPRRMMEIARNVLKAYPHVQRIVITEVRPSR